MVRGECVFYTESSGTTVTPYKAHTNDLRLLSKVTDT